MLDFRTHLRLPPVGFLVRISQRPVSGGSLLVKSFAFGATGKLKSQTLLAVTYGAGLRANEVVSLRVGDIDGQRDVLRIEQGKGHKDRYAMLSPVLLECLRTCWRTARAE